MAVAFGKKELAVVFTDSIPYAVLSKAPIRSIKYFNREEVSCWMINRIVSKHNNFVKFYFDVGIDYKGRKSNSIVEVSAGQFSIGFNALKFWMQVVRVNGAVEAFLCYDSLVLAKPILHNATNLKKAELGPEYEDIIEVGEGLKFYSVSTSDGLKIMSSSGTGELSEIPATEFSRTMRGGLVPTHSHRKLNLDGRTYVCDVGRR